MLGEAYWLHPSQAGHLPLASHLVLALKQGAPWTCHGVISFAGVQGKEFLGCVGSVKDLMSSKRVGTVGQRKRGTGTAAAGDCVLDQSRCVAALHFEVLLLGYFSRDGPPVGLQRK